MVSCQYRQRGFPGTFRNEYGMRIHLRSCIHKLRKSTTNGNGISLSWTQLHRIEHRLRCDMEAFGSAPIQSEDNNEKFEKCIATRTIFETDTELHRPEGCITMFDNTPTETELMLRLARLCRKAGRKDVNEIIDILTSPSFYIQQFQKKCSRSQDCLDYEEELAQQRF